MSKRRNQEVILLSLLAVFHPFSFAGAEGPPSIALGPGVMVKNAADPFDYFTNSWTVIGLKNHPRGTRITPRGELVLAGKLLCRPLVGEKLFPLSFKVKKTLQKGYLPLVRFDFTVNDAVRYTLEAFACPLDDGGSHDQPSDVNYLNFLRITWMNQMNTNEEAHLGLQWQPVEGCEVRETSRAHRLALFSGNRLLSTIQISPGVRLSAEGSRVRLQKSLEGGDSASAVFAIPFAPLEEPSEEHLSKLGGLEFDHRAERTASFWEGLLRKGARLSVPEEKPQQTYLASMVNQFIGQDRGEIHAGEGFYDEIYIRDCAYQAISVAQGGYREDARAALETFFRFQRKDGRFESQKGQLDAHGYAIWALVEYYRLTGDLEWLRKAFPPIERAVQWIQEERRKVTDPASPFFGILPNAIADGENLWAGKHHIVGYDWQNLRGIQSAAEAARALGKAEEAKRLEREFEDYRKCILKALDRTGLPYIPPSYEKDGTHWGNLEAIFPTLLIDPLDPRLTATLDHVRNEFGAVGGENGGFLEGTIQWSPPQRGAIHPYMSQFVTNSHIIRGEYEKAIDGFYSFLLHTTSTQGFPEGVYYRKREAWGNTLPHLWAAGLYVTTLRNMLVREEGKDLHLLSAVPVHWLNDGKLISFQNAPTHFGNVDLQVRSEAETVLVEIDPPDRIAPDRIVVHLPPELEIQEAKVQDEALTPTDARTVSLRGETIRKPFHVTLRVRRFQKGKAMTFASKVAEYEAEVVDFFKPIPGLQAQSPAGIDETSCLKLDLSPFANTDPMKAPFNVPNAATFKGLPLGDRKVAGIPFHIIDPAKNGGKGFVVLNGSNSSAEFPRLITVPVGSRGRYLCILGNVTGWSPGDPGIGKWGAVCEYEIHYRDGSIQRIPLISGRTADDWLQSPGATDVTVGLQGDPWHLNLLVAQLRPDLIDRVVVRDLGTPASPVVAAMTVIK